MSTPVAAESFAGIFESLSTSIVVADADRCVTVLNPAAEALLGISRQQASGRAFDALFEDGAAVRSLLERCRDTGEKLLQRELKLKPRDGRDRAMAVDCRVTPLTDGDSGAFLIELDDLQRQLRIRHETERAARREASRTMLQQLAHEIRNPLSGVRGAAQLLEREVSDASLSDYTRVIIAEVDRLSALVCDLLGPTTAPALSPRNIHEIVEHVRMLVEPELSPNVTLIRTYDPSLPASNVDRDHLVQALLNLARNAIQAVGGRGTVELRTQAGSNYVIGSDRHRVVTIIDVIDDGPGVPNELRDRLFLPLVTGRADGHGLGLSIAQELVNRVGGLVEFTSEPGKTVFSIILPVHHD